MSCDGLSSSLTCPLAQIYRVFIDDLEDDGIETTLTVHVPRLQKQRSSNDCGCFAVASVVSYCYSACKSSFQQHISSDTFITLYHISRHFAIVVHGRIQK